MRKDETASAERRVTLLHETLILSLMLFLSGLVLGIASSIDYEPMKERADAFQQGYEKGITACAHNFYKP